MKPGITRMRTFFLTKTTTTIDSWISREKLQKRIRCIVNWATSASDCKHSLVVSKNSIYVYFWVCFRLSPKIVCKKKATWDIIHLTQAISFKFKLQIKIFAPVTGFEAFNRCLQEKNKIFGEKKYILPTGHITNIQIK